MKKILIVSIFLMACPDDSIPRQDPVVLKDTGTSQDVAEDFSEMDLSHDVLSDTKIADVSEDLSVDLTPDVETDMTTYTPRGTCESDADCTDGICTAIGDELSGWKTCVQQRQERTICETDLDQCCKSEDCTDGTNGVCLTLLPVCSGARPSIHNVCYYDECVSNADCSQKAMGVCIPGGAFGEGAATCFYGGCREDSDCTDGTEGQCVPFSDPCIDRFDGFHCVYQESECRSDEDCDAARSEYCAPEENGTSCKEFFPPA